MSGLLEFVWDYFDFAMYMPPLREGREIDVLAFLDYWHRARAARACLHYRKISASLLHRMLFKGWPNNLDGVYAHLRMLGHADRSEHAEAGKRANILEIETLREGSGHGAIATTGSSEDDPECKPKPEDEDLLFQALPDIAVRMYLWSCCQETIKVNMPGEPRTNSLESVSLGQFLSGLTAEEFLQLDAEQFIRDHVLPAAPSSLSQRGDRLMLLLHRIKHQCVFGTTFEALKAGLRLDPVQVEARLKRATEPAHVESGRAEQTLAMADAARSTVLQGPEPNHRLENRLSIEFGIFHVVFRTADGESEEGRFPQDKNLGVAYYRHLIQHPERDFSPGELEREIGRKGTTPDRQIGPSAGEDRSAGPTHDTILDDQAKREIANRIAMIERDLARAERQGDRAGVARLEKEREALDADLRRTTRNPKERRLGEIRQRLKEVEQDLAEAKSDGDHLVIEELESEHRSLVAQVAKIVVGGKDKYLDNSSKMARDRVKKAMEQARKRFILDRMQRLAHYLEQAMRYKNGAWSYRPSKSSPSWQT